MGFLRQLLSRFLALIVVAIATGTCWSAASDEVALRVAEFQREFRSTPKEARTPEQRRVAVEKLVGFDAVPVAEALAEAWAQHAEDLAQLIEKRQSVATQIAQLLQGQELGTRTLPASSSDALEELKAEARALATTEEGLREVEAALSRVVAGLRSEASLAWLLEHVIRGKKLPLSFKLQVARQAGKFGEPLAGQIVKALTRTKDPEELVVMLAGVRECGKAAQSCTQNVIALLAHSDVNVREQAAGALARLASPAAIEPLIASLAREVGHTRRRVAIALETLTGRNLGVNADSWKAWFAKEGARYLSGEIELSIGHSTLADALTIPPAERAGGRYAAFYGIPQDGHSPIYVIDCSGSMVVSTSDPRYGGDEPVDAGHESRIEATKKALIEVLGKLDARDSFDIVCFNDLVKCYSPKMLTATPVEVERAQTWVAELSASNSTNIHDAMQEAFRIAGRGARDKYYKSAVDTIFLLTDGAPTTSDGQLDSTERILAAVRAWNPQRFVVIHTIGIGKNVNTPFLRQIAEENGGRFVQH